MSTITSKWVIVLISLIAILLLIYLLGRKSVHAELIIEASPEQIWEVLMNEEGYKEWNNVLFPVSGEIKEGNKLSYKLVRPDNNPLEIGFKVVELKPNQILNQYGGIPGVFTYDHRYVLEELEGNTKVVIHEDFRGVIVAFWNPTWVQNAYADLLQSLRDHVVK